MLSEYKTKLYVPVGLKCTFSCPSCTTKLYIVFKFRFFNTDFHPLRKNRLGFDDVPSKSNRLHSRSKSETETNNRDFLLIIVNVLKSEWVKLFKF